jgi:hypothetical protein
MQRVPKSNCRFPAARLVLATLLALLGAVPVDAVEGYKNYKFGFSPQQVKKLCPVSLQQIGNDGWSDAFGHDCVVLMAADFPFLNTEREVNFVFTREGLVSVAFVLEFSEFAPVAKTLREKYGDGQLQPNPKEYMQMAARFDAGQPHSVIKITFDEDTVVLVGTRDGEGEATIVLLYTDPDAVSSVKPDASDL